MRNVRDLAAVYEWLLKELQLDSLSMIVLGFGGWIATPSVALRCLMRSSRAVRKAAALAYLIKQPSGPR